MNYRRSQARSGYRAATAKRARALSVNVGATAIDQHGGPTAAFLCRTCMRGMRVPAEWGLHVTSLPILNTAPCAVPLALAVHAQACFAAVEGVQLHTAGLREECHGHAVRRES